MKRIIAFLCVFLILFGILPYSDFAYADDTYSYAEDFLTKLGIIDENDSLAKIAPDGDVTRAEFALLVYRMFNGTLSSVSENYFSDVENNTNEYTAINTLFKLGVLNGTGSGKFEPDKEISFYDALAVVLRVMGYRNFSQKDNASFVVDTCARYSLLSRSDLGADTSKKGVILDAFAKLLNEETLEVEKIHSNGTQMLDNYKKSGDTVLSKYFDIYKVEGILNSDGSVNINGGAVSDKRILVENISIEIEDGIEIDAGANVDAYYINEKNPSLFAIYENSETRKKVISIYDNLSFENYVYEYEENGSSKKITINPANATFVYNGSLLDSADDKYFLPDYGNITFIDNNDDGKYEVVQIKSYISFVVKRVEEDGEKLIINGDDVSVTVSRDEICTVKDKDGNKIYTDNIKEGNTLSCAYVEKGGIKYAKDIVVSDITAVGYITETADKDGKVKTAVIDGNEYGIYPLNAKLQAAAVPNKEKAIYYIDFLGNIVDLKYSGRLDDLAVGYVVDIFRPENPSKFSATLRVFDELGRLKNYDCAKKMKIDSITEKDNIFSVIEGKRIKNEVILFKTDEDGAVNYIDTPEKYTPSLQTTADNKLVKAADDNGDNSGRGLYYSERNQSFGGRININADSVVFRIPFNTDNAEDNDFGFYNISDLIDAAYYPVVGYITEPNSPIADVAVVKDNGRGIGSNNGIAVVSSIRSSVNENGDMTYSLKIHDLAGERVYTAKSADVINSAYSESSSTDTTKYKVAEGDLVRYMLDENKEITQLLLVYDKSADKLHSTLTISNSYSYGFRTFMAKAASVNDGYVKLAPADADFNTLGANDIEYISLARIQKYFYIEKNKNGYIVSEKHPSQIKNVKTDGDGCPSVIVNVINQNKTEIFMYGEE